MKTASAKVVTCGLRWLAGCTVGVAAVALQVGVLGTVAARAATPARSAGSAPSALASGWTALGLQNGWVGGVFGTSVPAVRVISGIVYLRGGMATVGANPDPFVLPAGFRPAREVFVPVDLCGAGSGRLQVEPSGAVIVESEGSFSFAACFTSLDGVSFAPSAASFTQLALQDGWTDRPYGTAAPAARVISGTVHLEGAMATTGVNPFPFTLPPAFRPARTVFVKADLCNAANGALQIDPSGLVTVKAEGGQFANAACFTSLDGISYATSSASYTRLKLRNGWHTSPFGTAAPAIGASSGIIRLRGAIATSGTSPSPFTLPARFRPAHVVYIPIDLCTATNGRLQINPSGQVTVEPEGGTFTNAACFTSLDGTWFAR